VLGPDPTRHSGLLPASGRMLSERKALVAIFGGVRQRLGFFPPPTSERRAPTSSRCAIVRRETSPGLVELRLYLANGLCEDAIASRLCPKSVSQTVVTR